MHTAAQSRSFADNIARVFHGDIPSPPPTHHEVRRPAPPMPRSVLPKPAEIGVSPRLPLARSPSSGTKPSLSLREISCLFIGAALAIIGYGTIALFLDLAAQV